MPENGYLSVFSCAYWKGAVREFKSIRKLTFAALMIAASVIISSLFIPVGENLLIYFSYLANAVLCLVCGPVVGVSAGFIVDMVDYFLHPLGGFFPGYTLSTMLEFLVFALLLYRCRVTVTRIVLARLIINIFINVGLGSLWSAMLYGKAYYYYLAKGVVKNLIMLPIEVILLLIILRAVMPLLARKGFIPKPKGRIIPIF